MAKKLLLIFGGLLSLLLLLLISAYTYVAFNKTQIIQKINENLQTQINGEIHIEDISLSLFYQFPRTALKVENLYLRGPKYAVYHKDFLRVSSFYLLINPFSLLNKQIRLNEISIQDAEAFIFKTKDGYSNLDVFKKDTIHTKTQSSPKSNMLLNLDKLLLKNTRIVFHDSLKEKYFGLTLLDTKVSVLGNSDTIYSVLNGPVTFDGLVFKASKGAFLKNKTATLNLNLCFLKAKKQMLIDSGSLAFPNSLLNLKGNFLFHKPLEFSLNIQTQNADIKECIALLDDTTQYKLGKFHAEGLADATVNVHGKAIPNHPPHVKVWFQTHGANAQIQNRLPLHHLNVEGTFENGDITKEERGPTHSSVTIKNLTAQAEGIPIKANAYIHNFKDPDLTISLEVNGPIHEINKQLPTDKIEIRSGWLKGKLSYQGKLKEYYNDQIQTLNGKLDGQFNLSNGSVYFAGKDLLLNKINANIHLNQKAVTLQFLNFYLNADPIALKGKMEGYIPFFTQPKPQSKATVSLNAPHLNLGSMFKPGVNAKANKHKAKNKGKFLKILKNLEKKIEIEVALNIEALDRANFKAKNVKGNIVLKNNAARLNALTMNFAGGTYLIKGGIENIRADKPRFLAEAHLKEVDVSTFLKAFDDFQLPYLTHKHISGTLAADVDLKGQLDTKGGFVNKQLKGTFNMHVENGKLINFEPIQKIGSTIYRNRDLSVVEFADINGSIAAAEGTSNIHRMEISSSLIRLFVEGKHQLQGGAKFKVQIPLKSITEKHKGVPPENIGTDAKTGPSVYLMLEAEKGQKMKIKYIPFPKKAQN